MLILRGAALCGGIFRIYQEENMFDDLEFLWPVLSIAIPVLLVFLLILLCWRKVPADKAIVITGIKKRVLSGRGGIMLPIFETSCVISRCV